MPTSGIKIGRIFGIPIYLHSSRFIIFALFTYLLATQFAREHQPWGQTQHWTLGLLTSLLFFGSVLFHELAHCVVAEPHWSQMITALGVDNAYVYVRGGDDPRTSFRARMFAPTHGIPEDPATGSATALLAAQLLRTETLRDGTHKWQLEQGYEMGRPSDLFLEADVNQGKLTAVRVAGQAVKVMQGTLEI